MIRSPRLVNPHTADHTTKPRQNWDTELKKMMVLAERPKPIITDYPPPDGWKWQKTIGLRMCDGYFTEPGIEAQIVRLEGSSQMENKVYVRVFLNG